MWSFFYVGGWEERKNVGFLIENFISSGIENAQLILGGGRPEEIEFWKDGKFRLHDRIVFRRSASSWKKMRLYP